MSDVFPLTLDGATAFYVLLYVLTLVPHVVFVGFVLLGVAWLLAADLGGRDIASPISASFRSSLPVALSGAITAAIAPLLFLQILYREEHYTANLLLFHRWMSILPALIVGFYALYVVKSERWGRHRSVRLGALAPALAAFAWTGHAWTENHLLANAGRDIHVRFYADQDWLYFPAALVPRLLALLAGAVATGGAGVLWFARRRLDEASTGRLALVGLSATLIAALGASWYATQAHLWGVVFSESALPWSLVTMVAGAVTLTMWGAAFKNRSVGPTGRRTVLSSSLVAALSGSVLREMVRQDALGVERIATLAVEHAHSLEAGGIGAFVGSFVVVALALIVVQRTVAASRSAPVDGDS